MADDWKPLPLDKGLYANVDPDAVGGGWLTALENGFVNEQGTHTRFPGLIERADLGNRDRTYLNDHNGDMIATTDKGQVYRIDRSYNITNVTGVPVSGGRRTIFTKSDRGDLFMAAGGPIVRLRNTRTELLSSAAPQATHVQWIDGYTIAAEVNSGRFLHSPPGEPETWDPLDSFAADGNADNINSLMVTPFRELMVGGEASIEQFERLSTGDTPFFRRWSVGDGIKFPYAMLFADNALFSFNKLREFVRSSNQSSTAVSTEIGKLIEAIDNWQDVWIGGFPDTPLHVIGQKFMVIQAPLATNSYGTKGVTLLYDYRAKKFASLYGWDDGKGVPARWPGWSHWTIWDKTYVSGEGKVYELADSHYAHGASGLQRWLIRTSKVAAKSGLQIRNFRLHIKRGVGTPSSAPTVQVRCRRNGGAFGPWISRSLGRAGDTTQFITFGSFGNGQTFQWEISSADNCKIELFGADVLATPIGH